MLSSCKEITFTFIDFFLKNEMKCKDTFDKSEWRLFLQSRKKPNLKCSRNERNQFDFANDNK